MARIRTIKPGFFLNPELARLTLRARLLFIGLWQICDRRGFLKEQPEKICAQIFPYERVKVSKFLDELTGEFIERLQIGDVKYIKVVNFAKHQIINKKEVESLVPEQYWGSTSTVPAGAELYNCKTVEQEEEEEDHVAFSPPQFSGKNNKNELVLSYKDTLNEFLNQEIWQNSLCTELSITFQFLIDDMQNFLSKLNSQGQFPRKLGDTKRYYHDALKKHLEVKVGNSERKIDYTFGVKK